MQKSLLRRKTNQRLKIYHGSKYTPPPAPSPPVLNPPLDAYSDPQHPAQAYDGFPLDVPSPNSHAGEANHCPIAFQLDDLDPWDFFESSGYDHTIHRSFAQNMDRVWGMYPMHAYAGNLTRRNPCKSPS